MSHSQTKIIYRLNPDYIDNILDETIPPDHHIYVSGNRLTDKQFSESRKNIRKFLETFETTEKMVIGDFGAKYDLSDQDRDGMYGYLVNQILAAFKYGGADLENNCKDIGNFYIMTPEDLE